jgi:hypothetical protein
MSEIAYDFSSNLAGTLRDNSLNWTITASFRIVFQFSIHSRVAIRHLQSELTVIAVKLKQVGIKCTENCSVLFRNVQPFM